MLPVIFVHLGPLFAQHLIDSIVQVHAESPTTPIHVVLSDESPMRDPVARSGADVVLGSSLQSTEAHNAFLANVRPTSGRKKGFWVHTTERFFVLEEAMRLIGTEKALHLESDNLIFFDVARVEDVFADLYKGLAAPFLNDHACVPGVVYVGDVDVLAALNAHIVRRVRQKRGLRRFVPGRVGKVRLGGQINDMRLLADFRSAGSRSMSVLPMVPPGYEAKSVDGTAQTLPYSEGLTQLGMLFDAAAFGQFLMGVDGHFHPEAAGVSFVNRESAVNPEDFRFTLERTETGGLRPFAEFDGRRYRIGSVHNHSKKTFSVENVVADMKVLDRSARSVDAP